MHFTAMPKAAIDENEKVSVFKNKIWFPANILSLHLLATDTMRNQSHFKGLFCRFCTGPLIA